MIVLRHSFFIKSRGIAFYLNRRIWPWESTISTGLVEGSDDEWECKFHGFEPWTYIQDTMFSHPEPKQLGIPKGWL